MDCDLDMSRCFLQPSGAFSIAPGYQGYVTALCEEDGPNQVQQGWTGWTGVFFGLIKLFKGGIEGWGHIQHRRVYLHHSSFHVFGL